MPIWDPLIFSFRRRRASTVQDDFGIGLELIGEVRLALAERCRVCGSAVARRLRSAQGTHHMVVSIGDIGPVLAVERHLEKVGQVAIGAAPKAARRNGPRVNDMIARRRLLERRYGRMAIDSL